MADPVQEARKTLFRRFASRLKFPQLFMVTAGLFLVDLLVPDLIPFVDEAVLFLATMLLGMWQNEGGEIETGEKPPIKDVTPDSEP